jgi:manganese/iron transport system permease protein
MNQQTLELILATEEAVDRLVKECQKGGPLYKQGPKVIAQVSRTGKWLLAALAALHKELVLGAFDPQGAAAVGYRTALLDPGLLAIVTVALVTAVPAVGTLLAVALLTVPALAARLWVDRVVPAMVVAAGVGAVSGVAGLCLSALFGIAAGGAIALSASAAFVLSAAGSRLLRSPS